MASNGAPFPADLVLEGDPIQVLYDSAEWGEKTRQAPLPKGGKLTFDGFETRRRPLERATVVQFSFENGASTGAHYLYPHDPLPTYPNRRIGKLPDTWGIPVAIAAGVFAVGAVGLLGAGKNKEAAMERAVGLESARDLRDLSNRLYLTGYVFGYAALAVGVGSVLVVVF